MTSDFTIFYKTKFNASSELNSLAEYDVFISGFNRSKRVNDVFNSINSKTKHWLILPQYFLSRSEYPSGGNIYSPNEINESQYISEFFQQSKLEPKQSICIDITGILIPHLLVFLRCLKETSFQRVDFIYSEPSSYKHREETVFSEDLYKVRQIQGFEGNHDTDSSNDLLIISSGYDDSRITDVANSKNEARKVQIFGFPSLQPDMYQENLLNAYKAEGALGGTGFTDQNSNLFAPASDPFVLAQELKIFIDKEHKRKRITNLYISPLSTKAHALGIGVFYLWECENRATSIIYPFCEKYPDDTSDGISKIWKYTVEFPRK